MLYRVKREYGEFWYSLNTKQVGIEILNLFQWFADNLKSALYLNISQRAKRGEGNATATRSP